MTLLVGTLLALAVGLLLIAFYRLKGIADRLVVVDAFSACAIGACLLAAAQTGHTAFLDVALGFAVIAFLATVSWANALSRLDSREDGE